MQALLHCGDGFELGKNDWNTVFSKTATLVTLNAPSCFLNKHEDCPSFFFLTQPLANELEAPRVREALGIKGPLFYLPMLEGLLLVSCFILEVNSMRL